MVKDSAVGVLFSFPAGFAGAAAAVGALLPKKDFLTATGEGVGLGAGL